MKRTILILTALLLLATTFLAACGSDESGSSSLPESESSSEAESSEESLESDEDIPEDAVKLLYTRYTESKPTFVMIGTCAQDAEVTAQLDDETVTVESYMGWFSISFTKSGGVHDVTFTQTVNGEQYDIPRTYRAVPLTPTLEQDVIASNGAFQFFLSKMIPDHVGGNLYPSSSIASMRTRVKNRIATLREHNPEAEIIYMIIPSPMTIYPELVPETYKKNEGESRLDQVIEGLKEAGATVIDVRETFNEHKNDEMPIYYKLDSHWADYGAYLAYTELFNHISQKFPEAAPRDIDNFDWIADYYKSADVIMYLNIPQEEVFEYGYYREFKPEIESVASLPRYRLPQLLYSDESTEEIVYTTGNEALPSCIVHRDSYGAGIYDLIPERMNKTHYIGMWNYGFNNSLIASEKPDYVIYILAEWNLDQVVNK